MYTEQELSHDFMLSYHNAHGISRGREVRIHEKTVFRARKRVVECCRQCTRQRFLRFLPLKNTETREYLPIPEEITTEEALYRYVRQKKPGWLHERHYRGR